MDRKHRRFRPTPAMIVALIALFVAMGGVGYAAVKLKKNAVKTKNIKNGAVTTPKLATDVKAPDATKLGGIPPAGYQSFCQAGAIKGSIVADTTGLGAAFTTVPGFNCGGGAVQIRRTAVGNYDVLFVGGAGGSGSAVVSGRQANFFATANGTGAAGTFHVVIETGAGAASDNKQFSLLAF